MVDFFNSYHCSCRVLCVTCRDLEGGRTWREELSRAFSLPNNEIDFICPHGVPWNPTPEQLPEPARAALPKPSLIDKCRKCENYDCDMGRLVRIAPCKARKKLIGFKCPEGLF